MPLETTQKIRQKILKSTFKNMGNTIFKMYPPVVPVRICDENKEAIKFLENVYTKNK